MTAVKCAQCEREFPGDALSCPICGYPIKASNQPPPRTRRGFLELTELLGFLLIALALLFFVLAYIMFFAGKVENGIVCASIGLVLLVWGGKAFKGLFPGA